MFSGDVEKEKLHKEKLMKCLKKEVKMIMEEAVTKRIIHEDSASITSLCGAIELCLSHGLKRRALGLFKNSSTTALLHKVAKNCEAAAIVADMLLEIETRDLNKGKSSGSEGSTRGSRFQLRGRSESFVAGTKYLWIRLALIEKQLVSILEYIAQTSSKYYERDALISDPDYGGSILSSLLVGPCALEYSRHRNAENMWSDPPANELIQRHRISSVQSQADGPSPMRPALSYKRNSGLDSRHISKDYVESLHQTNKSTLLYGKNNVILYLKGTEHPVPGYLSLHQHGHLLNIKWTPNDLMNASNNETNGADTNGEQSMYWNHALNVYVHEIVFVHCHRGQESDWIVLVAQDGVQSSPIHFPRGGHLLAFLSCLENGLLPYGVLDPPLWSQDGEDCFPLLDKDFPKLRKKEVRGRISVSPIGNGNDPATNGNHSSTDFVFRISYGNFEKVHPQEEVFDSPLWSRPSFPKHALQPQPVTPRSTPIHSVSTTSSTSSSRSLEQQYTVTESGEPIYGVCRTMKKQIISRAFYGWLAHVRHLKTIRTHLTGIVFPNAPEPECTEGLLEAKWEAMTKSGNIDMAELCRIVYLGGVQHSLRPVVWPVLLRGDMKRVFQPSEYEDLMSQWLQVEKVVKERDKGSTTSSNANLVKLSSGGTFETQQFCAFPQIHESNDVFEDTVMVDSSLIATVQAKLDQINGSSTAQTVPAVSFCVSATNEPVQDETASCYESGRPRCCRIPEGNTATSDMVDSVQPTSEIVYSNEIIECFSLNLHRIDKDVKRCDRSYAYFTEKNLDKLRNIMCTYVWEHMDLGYIQGMCDLCAPILVILDDEIAAYECFRYLMVRMSSNFPSGGGAMDVQFTNMRSLLQVLDHDLFTLIKQNGDYSHFYFCYRWFLLDFKREFCYNDVFLVWETIWAARYIASADFVLFIALALLDYYRDIILANCMDFTDTIKFFNEMAERHDAKVILQMARNLVTKMQSLIENK